MPDQTYAPDPIRRPVRQSGRLSLRERRDMLVLEFKAAPDRWRRFAARLALALAFVLALGALHDITGWLSWFNIRGEVREGGFYIPVLFNWSMLCLAGLAAFLMSRRTESSTEKYAWIGIGLLLGFMGFDELLMIHERIEFETGVDFQILYAPFVAVGGIGYLVLLTRMYRWSLPQVMWITAAAFWFVSQVLENLEYDPNDVAVSHFTLLDYIEKVFQFTGSALFLLVTTLALARALNRSDPGAS